MAAIALTMFAAVILAGMAIPAQAQTYPVRFPDPSTFIVNNDVGGSISAVEAAVVGDFNNDGKLDIVSMEAPGGYLEIDVALGNGDGTFQYPVVQNLFSPGQYTPYSMAVGDFNADGNLDVAVWGVYAANNASEMMIFLGNGNGTFNLVGTYAAPNSSDYTESQNALYVADFNGDGILDLAALTQYNGVFIFWGYGDGKFQPAVGYSTVDPNHPNNYTAVGMAVGDLNGDGKPDIAVTESLGMAVLLNNGNGTLGTATYYASGINSQSQMGIAIGDLTGDKKNDIVTTDSLGDVVVFQNQGNGTFAVKGVVATLTEPTWLVSMADINGDKKLDLVVTDFAGETFTFYGKGNGTFTAGPVYPLQYWDVAPSNVILADFNGDGALDIFKAGDHYLKGQVTLGRGDGTFQTNAAYGRGVTGFGNNLVTADFNGDHFPDVAFSYARISNVPAFGVMLGSLHGALAAPTYTTFLSATCSGSYPVWIATGDVNGDGKADIVATINNYQNTGCPINEVAVFTGLGTGKFSKPVFYSTGASAQSNDVFLADVNGDGKPDIVISSADGTISVLLNKGKGTFGTAALISSVAALSPHLNALAIADLTATEGSTSRPHPIIRARTATACISCWAMVTARSRRRSRLRLARSTATPTRWRRATSTRMARWTCSSPSRPSVLPVITALPPTLFSTATATVRLPLVPPSAWVATIPSIHWSATSMEMGSWTRSSPCWRSTGLSPVRRCSKAMEMAPLTVSASSMSGRPATRLWLPISTATAPRTSPY